MNNSTSNQGFFVDYGTTNSPDIRIDPSSLTHHNIHFPTSENMFKQLVIFSYQLKIDELKR